MKIIILKPEQFVQHRNKIGVILFDNPTHDTVNFFTGDMSHRVLNRNLIGSPSMADLDLELLANDSLRYLAIENNLITVSHQHEIEFLKYADSYN
tara:strand:- start:317 stop:601 length:285 start_codon:yes stop_codon:yes gene_type:complete